MTRATKLALCALVLGLSASACRRSSPELDGAGELRAPGTADRGELCLDVGASRACWAPGLEDGTGCIAGTCLVERTLPKRPAPRGGWRCVGSGESRSCAPRARSGGGFSCDATGKCIERRPRYPDDGEWECADRDGISVCRGGIAAAGTVPGPPDPGWICGTGATSFWGERVCVDLSPDLPDEERGWRCRYEVSLDERRVCEASAEPRVGGPCGAPSACPDGSSCVRGTCLPPRPRPSCFVDSDCRSKKCRFGSCVPDVP